MAPVTARDTLEQSLRGGATTRRYNYGKGMEPVTARDTFEQSLEDPTTRRYDYDKGVEPVTARNALVHSLGDDPTPGVTIMVREWNQ